MTLKEAILKRISEICDERGMTINGLATLCGITQSTLSSSYTMKNVTPSIYTIKKVCDGLGITLREFFDTDYFDSLEQEIK